MTHLQDVMTGKAGSGDVAGGEKVSEEAPLKAMDSFAWRVLPRRCTRSQAQ